MSRLISQFFCNLNSSKKFICPSGKLITKSTSPGPSDTTFSARQDTNRVQLTVLDNPWVNIIIICWEQVQVQLEVLGLGQGLSYRIKSSLRTCTSANQILYVYQCLFLFYFLQHSNFLTLAAKVSINVADYMFGLDSLPLLYCFPRQEILSIVVKRQKVLPQCTGSIKHEQIPLEIFIFYS